MIRRRRRRRHHVVRLVAVEWSRRAMSELRAVLLLLLPLLGFFRLAMMTMMAGFRFRLGTHRHQHRNRHRNRHRNQHLPRHTGLPPTQSWNLPRFGRAEDPLGLCAESGPDR